MSDVPKMLIVSGIFITVIGVLWYFFGNIFSWFGRLPGDIRIEKEHTRFYFPITTMLLLSIVFSLLMHVFKKLF